MGIGIYISWTLSPLSHEQLPLGRSAEHCGMATHLPYSGPSRHNRLERGAACGRSVPTGSTNMPYRIRQGSQLRCVIF